MNLQIITPEKTLFSGEASMVTCPGAEGVFGVLPGHMALVSSLREGTVEVAREGAEPLRFAISGGVAEVTPEKCVILAEGA